MQFTYLATALMATLALASPIPNSNAVDSSINARGLTGSGSPLKGLPIVGGFTKSLGLGLKREVNHANIEARGGPLGTATSLLGVLGLGGQKTQHKSTSDKVGKGGKAGLGGGLLGKV